MASPQAQIAANHAGIAMRKLVRDVATLGMMEERTEDEQTELVALVKQILKDKHNLEYDGTLFLPVVCWCIECIERTTLPSPQH